MKPIQHVALNIGDFLINFLIKIFHCAFPISLDSFNLYSRVSNSAAQSFASNRHNTNRVTPLWQ